MNITAELVRELAPTGRLRAALNMANPVLAYSHTASEKPAGVSIDLARAFAALLGVEVSFQEYVTSPEAASAVGTGVADIGFLAVDPQRAQTLHFSPPYVQIEGAYLVREESPLRAVEDVDQPGMRVVAGTGTAYELYLSRNLKHAQVVKVATAEIGTQSYLDMPDTHAAAGVKQQMQADAARYPGVRLLPGRFMVILQAMMMRRAGSDAAHAFLDAFVAEKKASGFVAQALARHGIEGAEVAE